MLKALNKIDVSFRNQKSTMLSEWAITDQVIIAWPELSGFDSLVSIYYQLIEDMYDVPFLILVKRNSQIENLCQNNLFKNNLGIQFLVYEELDTIKLAYDFPLLVSTIDGGMICYRNNKLPIERRKINLFSKVQSKLNQTYVYSEFPYDFIFDAGYLVQNGNGFGIVSNRLISVNEHLSIETINSILLEYFGLNHILYIPVVSEMETGYINTQIRFADESNLLIVDYNQNIYKEEHKFLSILNNLIYNFIKVNYLEIQIIRIQNYIFLDKNNKPEIANYLNYIRINDCIYYPTFGNAYHDEASLEIFQNMKLFLPSLDVKPIRTESWELLNAQKINFRTLFWNSFKSFLPEAITFREKTGLNPDTQLINYFLKNNLDFKLPEHIYFLIEDTIQKFWEKEEKIIDTNHFCNKLEQVFKQHKINIRRKSFIRISDVTILALRKFRFLN